MNQKRLIAGSTYYLRELSRLFMIVMGRDNFLPKDMAITKEFADIPQFFAYLDNRKPVELWFEEKLDYVIRGIFDFRMEHEINLSKQ
jgi:hypothetical protein